MPQAITASARLSSLRRRPHNWMSQQRPAELGKRRRCAKSASSSTLSLPGRTTMGEQFLAGIRIVDLTSVVVGPAATMRLADYGADVIKIEAPEGDLMRVIGGPSHSGELSGKFMHFNRLKRFACLNLKLP